MAISIIKLRQILVNYFNESEVQDISFDLGVDYENLPGSVKGDKARELIAYLERRGRISELEQKCYQLRPHAFRDSEVDAQEIVQSSEPMPDKNNSQLGNNGETKTGHQTHFHGTTSGPIHTGSGDVNVTNISNPFTLNSVKEWLDDIFLWSEADEHARSSWAGMVLWSLTAVTNRITPQSLLSLLIAIVLWITTAWLIVPILQWPLDDPSVRLVAAAKFALAAWLIPLVVALLTTADQQADFQLDTRKQRFTLFVLKLSGALVGFTAFAAILFLPVLFLHYLQLPYLPTWVLWVLCLVPLLFCHISARHIPADRYKMFGSKPQLHTADKLFLGVFLFFGPALTGFVYFWYSYLANRQVGFLLLLAFIGVVLWERRKQAPQLLSDLKLIFILGLLLPLLALLIIFFVVNPISFTTLPTAEQLLYLILVGLYFIGLLALWFTLQVRNKPVLTLSGVLGLLFVLLLLNFILYVDLLIGRIFTLLLLGVWLVWGRKRYRRYLWIHSSMAVMLLAIGLSLVLVVQTAVPLWINTLVFLLITTLLLLWAYRSAPDNMTKSNVIE